MGLSNIGNMTANVRATNGHILDSTPFSKMKLGENMNEHVTTDSPHPKGNINKGIHVVSGAWGVPQGS